MQEIKVNDITAVMENTTVRLSAGDVFAVTINGTPVETFNLQIPPKKACTLSVNVSGAIATPPPPAPEGTV